MQINDIEHFGNCVFCHRQLVKREVVGGKVQFVLDADASDSFFKLNTGSILVVPICKPCKATVNLDNPIVQDKIWKEVNHGWTLELHHMRDNSQVFPDHTPEKAEQIKTMYAGLSIVGYEANHKVGVA